MAMKRESVRERLGDKFNSIDESILEHASTNNESWVYGGIHGTCVELEISVEGETDSEIEDNLDDPDYDREFVEGVNEHYPDVKQEFEVAVREFFETTDYLKLRHAINNITII